ncbi:class I SAM-dependent methyltransferase [Curtobacterium poinsettiae]|uniref:Methyltransferase domain-containing protein n=1 Tax=Curtobacterium poinsettiae TaxID=159612 RepID=A0ABT3S0I0_9MICO|nr:methyltransferase domain-containing protein [Curtobacterium flaccumfaciens]MBT1608745.1 methyltransferase domain-containing protein [Curtobacterium flaccumfaciens pv. poinsettiae]MCX2848338.1 methyltransferase domain-containing protein [Curtobacterium flaccumfaciens pv. poinsettiae]UXN18930.1 class I SAM-dependent methyltransferase [Curtobacterium flaccumfaciens pv. poinsettiae]
MTRTTDGSAGDADRRQHRRPEPAFARAVAKALGDARTVLDVGAGAGAGAGAAGSYAPTDRDVTAVQAAEDLPFADDTFDATVTTFSLHGWAERGALERGLAEVRRVTRGPIVIVTFDPDRIERSWLAEYAPEVLAAEARRHPALPRIADTLGDDTVMSTPLPIPFTCVDGFSEAYYARPERLLDPAVRRADPAWDLVDEFTVRRSVAALRTALESGEWDRRHGSLRIRPTYEGSVVLVTATPN